jgi:hypothetical protein
LTASFNCPKCGAPLEFDPDPGDTTIVCEFCGETAIIPQELRIPLPAPVAVTPQTIGKPWWQNWFVIVAVLIALFGLGDFIIKAITVTSPVYVASSVLVATRDAQRVNDDLRQAQATFEANSTAQVKITAEAQATLKAAQALVKQRQNWPVLLTEKFLDNNHQWVNGDVRDDYLTGSRTIDDGKYRWNVTSVTSAFVASYPDTADQSDFFASVDMKYKQMPDDPSADVGLALRYSDADQSWYYFSVNPKGQYYFGWYGNKEWTTLISTTDSSVFRPGEVNKIAVSAQGSQFIFMINDQVIDQFNNDALKTGNIGLGINLPETGEKADVEFSNFSVLAPEP